MYIIFYIYIFYIYIYILYMYKRPRFLRCKTLTFVLSVQLKLCMICPSCHTFPGSPCSLCLTADRIKGLVTTGRIGLAQEAEALRALRNCAGQLQDLVEVRSGVVAPEEKGETEDLKRPEKKHKKDRDSKKDKKSTKKDKGRKSSEESGERVSPGERDPPGKDKKDKDLDREEEASGRRRKRGHTPAGDSSGVRPEKAPELQEEMQDIVDTYALGNPDAFELSTLPERAAGSRSSERHHGEVGDVGRPREPDYPPPGVFDDGDVEEVEEESTEIPRRHYPAPKKNKGSKHRARGRWYKGPRRR